ncbi:MULTISPECIES: Hsp20/alpha crystallin family protein [Saliphagus]|uniref:Hsp20/alpha crystallin family protein n=1 Tax=Saliphagus infecundisoli TaxID=1849069 RepID=A0ABD5QE76_9EURY
MEPPLGGPDRWGTPMNVSEVGRSARERIYRRIGAAKSYVQENRPLPVDVLEGSHSYLVVFDSPGVGLEDVQVRYVDGGVRIRIDRFREFHDGFEMRFPGRGMALSGEATLPEDAVVDPDGATARLTDVGTLNVEIPKDGADADREANPGEIILD